MSILHYIAAAHTCGGQNTALAALGRVELQAVMSCHVDSENQTQDL